MDQISCDHKLRLVVCPIIYRVLYIPGDAGVLPSTVENKGFVLFYFGQQKDGGTKGMNQTRKFFSSGNPRKNQSGQIVFCWQPVNWLVATYTIHISYICRWWFQILFEFTPIWGRFPIWLIFFRWVETTNNRYMLIFLRFPFQKCMNVMYLVFSWKVSMSDVSSQKLSKRVEIAHIWNNKYIHFKQSLGISPWQFRNHRLAGCKKSWWMDNGYMDVHSFINMFPSTLEHPSSTYVHRPSTSSINLSSSLKKPSSLPRGLKKPWANSRLKQVLGWSSKYPPWN